MTFQASSHHGLEKWDMRIFISGKRRETTSTWAARMCSIQTGFSSRLRKPRYPVW